MFELVNKGEEACLPQAGQLVSRVSQQKDDIVSFIQTMPQDKGDHNINVAGVIGPLISVNSR